MSTISCNIWCTVAKLYLKQGYYLYSSSALPGSLPKLHQTFTIHYSLLHTFQYSTLHTHQLHSIPTLRD